MLVELLLVPLMLGGALLLGVVCAGWALARFVHPLPAVALYLGSMSWALLYAVEAAGRCRGGGCSEAARFTDQVVAFMVAPTLVLVLGLLALRGVVLMTRAGRAP